MTDHGVKSAKVQTAAAATCCKSQTDQNAHSCGCGKSSNGESGFENAAIGSPNGHVHTSFLIEDPPARGKLFYASQTGTSLRLAQKLHAKCLACNIPMDLVSPASYEPEDLVKEKLVVIVASTWQDGQAPGHAAFFAQWLEESSKDFRVGSGLLRDCKFGVFGVGSRAYGSYFNAVAKLMDQQLASLGALRILASGEADVDEDTIEESFEFWSNDFLSKVLGQSPLSIMQQLPIQNLNLKDTLNGVSKERVLGHLGDDSEDGDEKEEDLEETVVDLEDVAGPLKLIEAKEASKKGIVRKWMPKMVIKSDSQSKGGPVLNSNSSQNVGKAKEMVTPIIRANLEKQGYKIIGSHSGVKLCRWTKSQLRGRGGCYKHSFYGIESHRCMETTPSLACANKCVFCWRHHSNPVGKTWQWKMDDPIDIVNAALDQHKNMIKQMKGVPGVKEERLQEGLLPRHCALSLVGEPIMYPEINNLVHELHKRHISTFLVTNAQFPERITSLAPVTQLYVSVDAATKERLKAIDRPLFQDFWERFLDSLRALKEKRQRTVYRLTLVKGWNTEELQSYAQLLELGEPDFIEIKGVTYCGTSATSSLTMENVPWHEDVKVFAEALASETNGVYELACEHAHSCCVLLANAARFKIHKQWHTWIDYEQFHWLVASGKSFSSEDYMMPTPSWATYGAAEGGFDPQETRVKKERRHGALADSGGCT
ncbi:hypothetical protein O6H91_09G046000 [Diphasiastrum complanatum]|uniref:Uncharacterized protein n=5 Tax=Diphasiastrum complanatum TaxID=34168 RepID=A0ACC2CNT2_DIPCM|nr:hypothetical protein O6H91_09G046000 [Diphasiastrum complanatum]KAJ7543635.1 hypothetical protein O6H91_09G046000 [Diphasiastrum complanatum]KAJ7543636.1 hypothetical protein O6H91_09G046000 [Diphasiastrum complanatum]KAJ7543637.1 hypothetical protein O6H91_09G046000 [Diphasiastrum complanatum]KAJ7543638.1 hypothetical protein O6H91_09G046000 [Diphasiastrum complanatum]